MEIDFEHEEEIARFVANNIPHLRSSSFEPCRAIGVRDGDELVAGIIYNNFSQDNLEMSIASIHPRWATRYVLRLAFYYPFIQLGCKRVTITVAEHAPHVHRFVTRLGFVKEGVLRQFFGTEDAVVYGMLRNECRYL